MTRKRIELALVENESARKATLKKREQGLIKKMQELTTLCGIPGCIVIFNPKEEEPSVWPSREEATELFTKFEGMPKIEQETKKVDHEKLMTDRVEKLRENIAKQEKKNKEARASLLMHEMSLGKTMDEFSTPQVELLAWYSDMKLKEIKRQNTLLPPIKPPTRDSDPPPPPPPLNPLPSRKPSFEEIEKDPFFMEMFNYGGGLVDEDGNQHTLASVYQHGSTSKFQGFP